MRHDGDAPLHDRPCSNDSSRRNISGGGPDLNHRGAIMIKQAGTSGGCVNCERNLKAGIARAYARPIFVAAKIPKITRHAILGGINKSGDSIHTDRLDQIDNVPFHPDDGDRLHYATTGNSATPESRTASAMRAPSASVRLIPKGRYT